LSMALLLLCSRCAMVLAVEFDGLTGSMGFAVQDISWLFVDTGLLSFCSHFPSMATKSGCFAATAHRKQQLATSLVSMFSLFPFCLRFVRPFSGKFGLAATPRTNLFQQQFGAQALVNPGCGYAEQSRAGGLEGCLFSGRRHQPHVSTVS
jgi:hypothetical protein